MVVATGTLARTISSDQIGRGAEENESPFEQFDRRNSSSTAESLRFRSGQSRSGTFSSRLISTEQQTAGESDRTNPPDLRPADEIRLAAEVRPTPSLDFSSRDFLDDRSFFLLGPDSPTTVIRVRTIAFHDLHYLFSSFSSLLDEEKLAFDRCESRGRARSRSGCDGQLNLESARFTTVRTSRSARS